MRKFFSDLWSTRIQMTYALVGVYVWAVARTIQLARTSADLISLVKAMWPVMALVLGAYFGHKVLVSLNGNGGDGGDGGGVR